MDWHRSIGTLTGMAKVLLLRFLPIWGPHKAEIAAILGLLRHCLVQLLGLSCWLCDEEIKIWWNTRIQFNLEFGGNIVRSTDHCTNGHTLAVVRRSCHDNSARFANSRLIDARERLKLIRRVESSTIEAREYVCHPRATMARDHGTNPCVFRYDLDSDDASIVKTY